MISRASRGITDKEGALLMEHISYTAHVSNKKSAITSKSKLLAVAKHNLRKYKSDVYNRHDAEVICGTYDLYRDVKRVYKMEFGKVVEEYNQKQKRPERRIDDYFEHVANLDQDLAVEIIFQCGDRAYWQAHSSEKDYMCDVYCDILEEMQKLLPDFKVANAVIHFDEASPHMHVVGVPVWEGAKRGLKKKVSKRNVFTPETMSVILQDKLREVAQNSMKLYFEGKIKAKGKGRNCDLAVLEYKVSKEQENLQKAKDALFDVEDDLMIKKIEYAQETMKKEDTQKEVKQLEERKEAVEAEYLDKKELLEQEIKTMEQQREVKRRLSDLENKEYIQLIGEVTDKRSELLSAERELEDKTKQVKEALGVLEKFKSFVSGFQLVAPTIEEYANQVESGKRIEAGNSFRGILYEIGKLLMAFKELIQEGICWFPRLMHWKTSKGEVAPIFIERSNGYDYEVFGYMNVDTKEKYRKEDLQHEIKAEKRSGTVEQLDANMQALIADLEEILRWGEERRRLEELCRR